MKKVKITKVCLCGRGLRSHVDLLCARCIGKAGKLKREMYHKRLESFRVQLQEEMYGFSVDPTSEHRAFFVNVKG